MKKKDEKQRTKIIMSIFIAFIMITSVIGFMFGQYATQKFKFGKYTFTRTDQGFSLIINKQDVYFDYFPTEANLTNFSQGIDERVKASKMLYLTYDFNTTHAPALGKAAYDLTLSLNKFGIFVQPAFTNQTSFNVPVITCANSSMFVPVLYFKEANQTRAYIEANCIILEGDSDINFVRLKDRLLYGFFGILP